MIALRDVTVNAGAFTLTSVSFTIPCGAFGAVVGAAGSGKTTLLESVAGVRELVAGSIMLGDNDVTSLKPEARGVGLVYQRGALFPHKSVADNIGWAGHENGDIARIVAKLGIASLYKTPVTALSGGERQLVALARALVRVSACLKSGQRAVLLLDEPFSALDPRRRIATRDVVRAFHNEWKLTTLQVTHDGAEARRSDFAVLLDAGMVVQCGAPDELLASPAREDVGLFLSSAG
ncbi:MAG: ABC transporter ATP-binding protein [Gemmatimonadaceae bacterium]